MHKKWPIILLAVVVLLLVSFSKGPKPSQEVAQEAEAQNFITIYTDMPINSLQVLASAYEKSSGIHLHIVPLTAEQILESWNGAPNTSAPDLIWSSEYVLRKLQKEKALSAHISEQTDIVSPQFKDEDGFWTGTWYLPIVFAVEEGYYEENNGKINTWWDLLKNNSRIAMTDFISADLPAELLYSMVEIRGEDQTWLYLRHLQNHIVQYAKYLSTPVRLLALNKADIAIADAGTVRNYMAEGLPIRMIYPTDGTAYYLYAFGITKKSTKKKEAGAFMDWVLAGNAFVYQYKNRQYFYYTGEPEKQVADSHGHELVLWQTKKNYTREGEQELIAKWLEDVRFAGGMK